MVTPLAWGIACLATLAAQAGTDGPDPGPTRAVGSALGKGSYPWYDAPRDAVRPIRVPTSRGPSRSTSSGSSPSEPRAKPASSGPWGFGNLVATTGLVLGLLALVGLLAWLWKTYEPSADQELPVEKHPGDAGRVDELPESLRGGFDPSDPWSEAIRRRDRGDLAGAVVCLFAHQLLTLSRLGLVRLAPGRTGRQLLRAVTDPDYRAMVAPTLRLFEAAYYGHHAPSPGDFEAAWAGAEAFERRAAGTTR